MVGIEYFNPYPARGTLRQVPAQFFKCFELSYRALCDAGYTVFIMVPSTDAMGRPSGGTDTQRPSSRKKLPRSGSSLTW